MSKLTPRAYQIGLYLESNSVAEAQKNFGIAYETATRYGRLYREHKREKKEGEGRIPKILVFDIETSPMAGYFWGAFKQNINYQQIEKPWIIISWAAKWLYEADSFGDVLTIEEAKRGDDKRICETLLKAFNESDVIVAHNCKKFDDKRSKTRFFLNKLQPPTPYRIIDTLEQARKEFVMPSNRLDYLLKILYDDSKLPTEFALWPKCLNWFGGIDKKVQQDSLDYMFKYNKKDVFGLEDLYLELRPWIKNHPNIGTLIRDGKRRCYKCGSEKLVPDGEYFTPLGVFDALRCGNCGGIGGRERKGNLSKQQNEALLAPTPV